MKEPLLAVRRPTPRPPWSPHSALARTWPALLLGLALLGLYGPWLLAEIPRMGGDVTMEFYPRLAYAVGELRRGAMPLWAPFTLAGTPLHANPQLGLLYPVNWPLLLLLPVGPALNWSAVAHVALALAGTYALGRRWGLTATASALAAVSFGFNGMFAVRLWAGGLSLAQAAAWLPALLLAADVVCQRPGWRAFAALATALTLSLLVGFYQLWYWSVLVVAAYLALMPGAWTARARRLGILARSLVLALLLAAPQLVPAAELMQWTVRAGRLDWAFATDASLPPWHLPSLLLPELFGHGAGSYWPGAWWHWHERTAYAGLLALALVPLGLRAPRAPWVWFCLGLGLLALLLALGRYTPLYGLFHAWVPGYGSFRDPARHLLLASLAAAMLAGRGADRLLDERGRGYVLAALVAVVLLGAAAATALVLAADRLAGAVVPGLSALGIWAARAETAALDPRALGELVLLQAARACGLAVAVATLALVAVVLGRRLPRPWAGALLAGALFADLAVFGWQYVHTPLPLAEGVPFGPPTAQFAAFLGSENVAALQAAGPTWRAAPLGSESVVAGNAGYLLGTPLAIGLDPLLPRRYAELAALIDGAPLARFNNVAVYFTDPALRLAPLLNARYWLEPTDDAPRYRLAEQEIALPRLYLVEQVQTVRSPGESLAALAAPSFAPEQTVVLEDAVNAATPVSTTGDPVGTVANVRYAAGEVTAAVELARPAVLVLLEAWHPGWRATVDGQEQPVYPANHAFLGVPLDAGRHTVQLRYAPGSLLLGTALACVGVAIVVLLVGGRAWQHQRARRGADPNVSRE